MDLDSEVESRSQPSINPMLLDNVCNITLSHFRKLYLKCYQMIGCLVLITVVFQVD